MKNKKDLIQIVIAAVIAFAITYLIRLLIPVNVSNVAVKDPKEEISMPDIPLMAKDKTKKKSWDILVFVVSNNIKKGEKISTSNCAWKKWPAENLQPYFIAKDRDDIPINNAADYANAIKMWAKNDIPQGIPLTIQMLDDMDPVKREEEEKKKKLEEDKKNTEKIVEAYIKKGMRAVTLVVDQKSSVFNNMLYPGDLIDVLIMERKGDKVKTHKYKAVHVLAVDGSTTSKRKKDAHSENAPAPPAGVPVRNVTLEVKEDLIETIINQSSASGIIISIRSQDEKVEETELNKDLAEENKEGDDKSDSFVNDLLDIGRKSSIEKLLEKKFRKDEEIRNEDVLLNDIIDTNRRGSTDKLLEKKFRKDDEVENEDVLLDGIIDINRRGSMEKLLEKKSRKDEEVKNEDVLLDGIIDMNRRGSTDKLLEKKLRNDNEVKNEEVLLDGIIDVNRRGSTDKLLERKLHKDDESKSEDNIMNDIIDMNRRGSTDKLLEKKSRKDEEVKNEDVLLDGIIDINRRGSTEKLLEARKRNEESFVNDIVDMNRRGSTEKLLEAREHNEESFMNGIIDTNRKGSMEKLLEARERNEESFMNGIIDTNRKGSMEKLLEARERSEAENLLMDNINAAARLYGNKSTESQNNDVNGKGNYEVVCGKVLGDEAKHGNEKKAVIYKKLTAQEVKFDKDGNVTKGDNVSAAGK
ncbi:hypothetical protein FACS189472_11050 [Alphaproteobacteria bacterium]|nr:hypothetical protein FACS189472_11050 [Alphaproteobacteria bacterium]